MRDRRIVEKEHRQHVEPVTHAPLRELDFNTQTLREHFPDPVNKGEFHLAEPKSRPTGSSSFTKSEARECRETVWSADLAVGLDGMVEDTHGGDRNSISLRDLVFFGEWQKERVREAKHRLMWAMWRSHLREHSLSSIEANVAKRLSLRPLRLSRSIQGRTPRQRASCRCCRTKR